MMSSSATAGTAARQQIHDCWNRIGVRGDGSCPELQQHIHCRNCPVYSVAARALLRVPLPADHLGFWARHVAQPLLPTQTGTQAVLLFKVGTEWLAVPARHCVEVSEMRPIHSLPHRRNAAVLGLVNVRGTLLPCVSLAAVVHAEVVARASAELLRNGVDTRRLIVLSQASPVVIRVDEVHGVQRVSAADVQQAPATLRKGSAIYTKALLSVAGRSVGLLDEALLHHAIERALT